MDTNTDNKLRLFTRGQGKRLKLRGLRRRWLASSVGPIIVILVLVGVLSAATISSSLDARARSSLEAKAKSGSDYFSAYSMGSYSEYYRRAAQYVTDYSMNDSLAKNVELQFINGKRQVELSSRGAVAGSTPATSEVGRAVETGKTASFSGRDPLTGESILAVSSPVFYNGTVVAVMRFVTSTRLLDQQLWLTVLVMAAVIAAVIFLIFVSNLIFINNVVQPVAEMSEAAKRISSGSYGIQIANKYTDELGQLVDNINNMSLKISQSEKMQTEFISSVSHELRTPLTAISGWGETLLGDETGDPRQLRRGLRITVKEARRLTGMVEELLEFSKMQDGRFTLQVEEMDLQAELEDAIYTYRELFRQDGIQLNYHSDQELYTELISGDPQRLKQVFCNVLDNAAKHGGAGKRIDVDMTQEGDSYVVRIRDYGPGIPPAEVPFVKQKFYKGSSKARGSGIGLAVCDEIVQRHGGVFDIGNADGGGAIVTIRLPISGQEL
ncbi:MAG: ATP-binding protein [Oscillospiraceae bacterium]